MSNKKLEATSYFPNLVLPSITTPYPIKFNNFYVCPNNLIELYSHVELLNLILLRFFNLTIMRGSKALFFQSYYIQCIFCGNINVSKISEKSGMTYISTITLHVCCAFMYNITFCKNHLHHFFAWWALYVSSRSRISPYVGVDFVKGGPF